MEAHPDFGRCNGDIGGHVDEIAKDLAGLGVVVAAHAAGGQAVEGRGEDEEGHVEIDFEPDRGGKRDSMWKKHARRRRVRFSSQHPLVVTDDQNLKTEDFAYIRDPDRRLVVAEFLDE